MNWRDFITILGGAAAWPLAARAQQRAMPVVGYLLAGTPEANVSRVAAFRRGLSEVAYVEGLNVAIEYRWGQNQPDRLAECALKDEISTAGRDLYGRVTRISNAARQVTSRHTATLQLFGRE
jgi:hypothetical protein